MLMREARIWRLANSAQWVAWGVMQARVPGFEAEAETEQDLHKVEDGKSVDGIMASSASHVQHKHPIPGDGTDPLDAEGQAMAQDMADRRPEGGGGGGGEEGGEEAEEFDYLGYARDRAMFFWGDCLQLGFIKREELEGWGFEGEIKFVTY